MPSTSWLQDLDTKLCSKMGRVLGFVPGFRDSCKDGIPVRKATSLMPTQASELSFTLLAEKVRNRRLALSLKRERVGKQGKQRRLAMAAQQLLQAKKQIEQLSLRTTAMSHELGTLTEQRSQLEFEARAAEKERAYRELEMQSVELLKSQTVCLFSDELLSCLLPKSLALAVVLSVVIILVVFIPKVARWKRRQMEKEMQDKTEELVRRIAQLDAEDGEEEDDEEEDNEGETESAEGRACITETENLSVNLDKDFSFHIFDTRMGKDTLRSIKIKCPGVHHNDILLDIVFNGCVVTIERKPSHGVGATAWVKRFQFKSSDGFFDLKDDRVVLEGGFLTLVFRAFRSRVFRFPKHFDMSIADVDDTWLYSEECPTAQASEPNSCHPLAQAARALRIAAAADAVTMVPKHVMGGKDATNQGLSGDTAALNDCAASSTASSSGDASEDFEKLPDHSNELKKECELPWRPSGCQTS